MELLNTYTPRTRYIYRKKIKENVKFKNNLINNKSSHISPYSHKTPKRSNLTRNSLSTITYARSMDDNVSRLTEQNFIGQSESEDYESVSTSTQTHETSLSSISNRASDIIDVSVDGNESIAPFDEGSKEPGTYASTDSYGSSCQNPDDDRSLPKVGSMNCYCNPSRIHSISLFLTRTYEWTLLNKEQLLCALIASITILPETVSNAYIAGIHPLKTLQSMYILNILTSVIPFISVPKGIVNGSSIFIALATRELIEVTGVEYVYYASIIAGILQIIFAVFKFGSKFSRLVPRPVLQGFRNATAILIVSTNFRYGRNKRYYNESIEGVIQVGYSWEYVTEDKWMSSMEVMFMAIHAGIAFCIVLLLPTIPAFRLRLQNVAISMKQNSFGTMIPCLCFALAIAICTGLEHFVIRKGFTYESLTIGDYVTIGTVQPYNLKPIWIDDIISLPTVSWKTLNVVYPYALKVFAACIIESIFTAQVLDDINKTSNSILRTNNRREHNSMMVSQGLANVICAVFGGIGGSASVSQTILAKYSYGISKLFTFMTGVFLFINIYYIWNVIEYIPLGSIGGIMLYVAYQLMDWYSLQSVISMLIFFLPMSIRQKLPLVKNFTEIATPLDAWIIIIVMVLTVCIDISIAMASGMILSVLFYAWESSNRIFIEREVVNYMSNEDTIVTYTVTGSLFFATSQSIIAHFPPIKELRKDPKNVVINLANMEVYDISGMKALKSIHDLFKKLGKDISFLCLSGSSRQIMAKNAYLWDGVRFADEQNLYGNSNTEGDVVDMSIVSREL